MNPPSLRKLLPVILACIAATGLLMAVTDPIPVNALCPITGKQPEPGKTVTYSKDVKFCCEDCKAAFSKNPDEKVKEIAAVTPETKKCLMCEKPADKNIKATYMRVIAVSGDECIPQFKAGPDKYIVFAVTHPRPVNSVCPMSGGEVDPKVTVTYEKTVFFCGQEHHDAFNKAQDENVEKVAGFDKATKKCLMCDKDFDPEHKEVYRRTIGCNTQSHAVAFEEAADANIAKAIKSIVK